MIKVWGKVGYGGAGNRCWRIRGLFRGDESGLDWTVVTEPQICAYTKSH